ncbi:helix-turn-helix domain-containing protein [Clostridium gasigenes]|uniref:helix-turn-helix domain-containing protein n=2 Tax=Clostridium gasigenes TaxID=94869 RepID=UPI001C0BEE30|nr:helix-turn-helix domain-containing protein [Clostridium gasigenes]MBU3104944.1 helix-turn-helix domain-containing protein [Clostridium gasigenes]
MEKLQIGKVIYSLRKEKGVTQGELAEFIGISAAAVSKWEGGSSYPDITLLTIIATFFNVTIDRLLNFKIELSDEEVMKIYSECEAVFSSKDNLEIAIETSKNKLFKHQNNYLLKLRIGFLFFAYSWKADDEEKDKEMSRYAIKLLEDVSVNCNKSELVEAALFQLGGIYAELKEYDKAIEALNKIHKNQCDPNDILSTIYLHQENYKEARELMQGKLYKCIHEISMVCMGLAASYKKHEKDYNIEEKYHNLALNIKKTISKGEDGSLILMSEYLTLIEMYIRTNKSDKAIENLRLMVNNISRNNINDLRENINNIWCFDKLIIGEKTLTLNLYENIFKIFENPIYDVIRENKEFISILNELKNLGDC